MVKKPYQNAVNLSDFLFPAENKQVTHFAMLKDM